MNIIGIGTDIIEISRIKTAMEKNSAFLKKLFCESEIEYITGKSNQYQTAAGYFCAKEAVAKSLGTGFSGLSPLDIVISNDISGKPTAKVNGREDITISLSISHCKDYATATAVACD